MVNRRLANLIIPPLYHLAAAHDVNCAIAICWTAAIGNGLMLRILVENSSGRFPITISNPLTLLPKSEKIRQNVPGKCDDASLDLILMHGANIIIGITRGRDTDVMSALKYATKYGCEKLVRLLLEKGADVNEPSDWGNTVLHIAAARGHKSIIQTLLDAGADLVVGGRQVSAIDDARTGSEAAKILLEAAPVNLRDYVERTPLHMAMGKYNHEPLIRSLLDKGADVNAKERWGNTPLHIELTLPDCKVGIVSLLIERGADVNATDSHSWTPLHGLVRRMCIDTERSGVEEDITRLMLKAGANPRIKDRSGKTVIDYAEATSGERSSVINVLRERDWTTYQLA